MVFPGAFGQWLSGTLWLTNQERVDKDYAIFGEANWTYAQYYGHRRLRFYKFDNTLYGFSGFGPNPVFYPLRRRP